MSSHLKIRTGTNTMKTCPAGFKKHFQSYMRTRQKCNPEYIPLYLRSATFCWWQRSLNRPRHRGEIEEIQRTLNCWESFEQSSNFRTTQFSKRIKMESQVHFDLENFFHIKIKNISEEMKNFNMRVWSWLRMNAGGVPNTCKSNGTTGRSFRSDSFSLVADGWVTRG